MNYDLCSGTCLKKSGIYSVAMFQREKQLRRQLLFIFGSGCRLGSYAPDGAFLFCLQRGLVKRTVSSGFNIFTLQNRAAFI